jgi:antitoxin component of MazEF toxin-antitoxin module
MQEGDAVVIEASPEGIELRKADQVPTLEELVAQIKPENRYRETVTGQERGKEKVEW